jgi:E3 ubiquitin-protein ligase BRE1
MPAVESPVTSSDPGLVKMEDRKRPAADNNDSAPPLKKQATTVNGGSKPHPDADMPWKDDLEVSLFLGSFLRPESRISCCRVAIY